MEEKICIICQNKVIERDLELTGDVVKEVLDVLLLQINFNSKTSLICSACTTKLLAAFRFKSVCLYTEDVIFPYTDGVKASHLDLKEIFMEVNNNQKLKEKLDDQEICRLCMKLVKVNFKPISDVNLDILVKFIPEVNIAVITNSIICIKCHDALYVHSTFIKNCLNVKNRNLDIEDTLLTNTSLKTEEIEIKSEDDADFEILCSPEKEGNEDGDKSLDSQDTVIVAKETGSLDDVDDLNQIKIHAQSPVQSYKSKNCVSTITSESLFADHKLRYKRGSKIEVNKNTGSTNRKSKNQDNRKSLLKSLTKGVKVQKDQSDNCIFNGRRRKRHPLTHKDPSTSKTYGCDDGDRKSMEKGKAIKYQPRQKDQSKVKMITDPKSIQKGNLEQNLLTDKTHSKPQTLNCDKCNFTSTHKGPFRRHQLSHEDSSRPQSYTCDICKFTTKHKSSIKTHVLIHKDPSEVQMYQCNECDYKSIQKPNLLTHQLKHKTLFKAQMYTCDECKFTTKNKYYIIKHFLKHKDPSEVQMYKCEKCDYKTIYKSALKSHQLRHQDPSVVRKFKCDECDFKSDRKGYIRIHKLRHKDPSEVQRFKCDECDFVSMHKGSLRIHMLRHKDPSEVPVFQCDECNYKSISKGSLRKHKIQHKDPSEVQRFKCDECDFETIHRGNLRFHKFQHKDPSEVPMFKCDRCDYKSFQKAHLKVHQLTHVDPSEEQMFKCDECNYKSVHKGNLLIHQLTHKDPSQIQMYKCDKCKYKTKHKISLRQHFKTHKDRSERELFKCDKCDYKTLQKRCLLSHLMRH